MSRSSFYNSPAQRGDEGMLRHHPFVFGGLGRFQRIHALQLPSNATLAESPIDIFSMGLSAKVAVCGCSCSRALSCHFSSIEVARRRSCHRRSPVPRWSCSWMRQRRGIARVRDILRLSSPTGLPPEKTRHPHRATHTVKSRLSALACAFHTDVGGYFGVGPEEH